MQDAVLRVLVVALGLLLCPRDDPGLQEDSHDIIPAGPRRQKDRLLREEEELTQQVAPNGEKMTPTDGEPQLVLHATDRDTESDLEDVTGSKPELKEIDEHFKYNSNTTQLQNPKSVHVISQTPVRALDEQWGKQQKDMGSELGEEPIPSPEQQEKSETGPSLSEMRSKNETSKQVVPYLKEDYLWYIWNTFSIISLIRFLWKYLRKTPKQLESKICISDEVHLPDSNMLQSFYCKYVKGPSENRWKEGEFLEGFANHMVEAIRVICDGRLVIEDCQMLDWSDIIVPFTPCDPYSFQCLLWNHQRSDPLPNAQVRGQIKLVENQEIQDCPCHTSVADDIVCLLHCENKVKTKRSELCQSLCLKSTPLLSKSQVTRWFQNTIKQAWGQISHKYEFELCIRYIDAPGALAIQFRSGKKLKFSMNPVVKFGTGAHFTVTPCSPSNSDTHWTLSLTFFEDQLLQQLSQKLPANSCHLQILKIAQFLHRRQTALSGSSALKESHFKSALIHLLLTHKLKWEPEHFKARLKDLFALLERSLERKQLYHAVIGNPSIHKIIPLPIEFLRAKPVNLFHPLVAQQCIYRHAVMHLQEMLRNANVLIHDYVDRM